MTKIVFSTLAISISALYFGQQSSIDTIYIFDNQISKVKLFHKVKSISPEDAEKNTANLSDVLRFQTPVYVKENGRGATSSPSFRGTTAQQTAFVWNGININSTFLGQGDINNIPLFGYDAIDVKAGGGSVIYGSGAIGGSIHLNNELKFNKGFQGSLFSEVASFGTYNNFTKASFSNDKLSVKVSGNYSVSENNYEVDDMKFSNVNGSFYNTVANFGISYKLNKNQKLSWQSQLYDSSQHFPIYQSTETKTKYETQSTRSLLSWDVNTNKFANSLKMAYTEDNFQYFNNVNSSKFSSGESQNIIFKDDFNYFINSKFNFNFISEFQINKGEGYNNGIGKVNRNVGSFSGLLRYFHSEKLRMEAGIKKDFVEEIESPILYSFSGKWTPTNWYNVNFSFSKNFRFPSFNDIYYEPGGNKNLKSETSLQGDLNNEFIFGSLKLNITPYYMKADNLIAWLPTSMGYWQAFNVRKTESYGLESELSFTKKINEHIVQTKAGYYYSKSVNKETNLQQAYVPIHRASLHIDYQYRFMKLFSQAIFNGLTYTSTNEDKTTAIDPYFVLNAGISATLQKKYTLGFKANNITDTYYKTVAFYPMPKRNYSIFASIQF